MVYADNPVPFIVTDPVRLFHDRHTGQDNKELPLTEPYPDIVWSPWASGSHTSRLLTGTDPIPDLTSCR